MYARKQPLLLCVLCVLGHHIDNWHVRICCTREQKPDLFLYIVCSHVPLRGILSTYFLSRNNYSINLTETVLTFWCWATIWTTGMFVFIGPVSRELNWCLCFRFGLREGDFCERQPRGDRQRQQQSQHQQVQYNNSSNSSSNRPCNKDPSGKFRENAEPYIWHQFRFLISVADRGSGAFLTPGSGMGKQSNQILFPRALKQFFGFKYLNSLMRTRDPRSGMEKTRIRDPRWKKFRSGINIPDPQHCFC